MRTDAETGHNEIFPSARDLAMHLMNRIAGIGAMSLFVALFGACAGALQPTACSAGAAAGEWIGEDIWVRADLVRVQRELACGADVNARNDDGKTPLDWAKIAGNETAVELLQRER